MSDSNMRAGSGGIIVGTAGHIDHGKTSLVGTLTGIDTDRLAEEKKRGISIDLGFAHFTLPSGRNVSFVDVPGHERFVRNMLAGAGGIEAVMLIVAANESVKPQTVEHFEICRLLGIRRGLVVLTKADLASPEQILAAGAAVQQLTRGSFLEVAPMIPVSTISGEGLPELVRALETLSKDETARDPSGFVRLPIDRSFALKGFGTVVTGTLWGGTLRAADTVELKPSGKTARIRGLQVHGAPVAMALAGQRTAVNLSGIDHREIGRGTVLVSPDSFEATDLLQVRLDWLRGAEQPARREQFSLHIGTAEVSARTGLFVVGQFAQIKLAEPVVAAPGDRFIVRRPSPAQTVGGGTVIDSFPPRRLSRAKSLARVRSLYEADLPARLTVLVNERAQGRSSAELACLTGNTPDQIRAALARSPDLLLVESAQRVVSRAWLSAQRQRIVTVLERFHTQHPSASGAPVAQVRAGLDPQLAAFVLAGFGEVRVQGELVALATHRVQVSPQEAAALRTVEQAFRRAGYEPPFADTVPRATLERLIKQGTLVRVSDKLVFHADVISHIRNSLAAHRGRRFSVPEFKSWIQISRKYAIPLLEYLDHQHVTKRDGDERIVL